MADTVIVKRTENRLIVTKEDKKVRITAPYVDNHYDATFASDAETLAGTETTKAVSPASLEAVKDVEGGLASKDYADGKVSQTITEDVEDKAPSEGAVFDALALKANASDVDDALALKADITLLNTEKQLLTQEIDALKKSAVENSNAPYLTVSDYGDVALAKNSVGVGTVGIDGVTVENIFTGKTLSGSTLLNGVYTLDRNRYDNLLNLNASNPMLVAPNTPCFIMLEVLENNTDVLTFNISNTIFTSMIQIPANTTGVFVSKQTTKADYTSILYNMWLGGPIVANSQIKLKITVIPLSAELANATVSQLSRLFRVSFLGKKTFGGMGCLVSKDSAEVEVGRMYFSTTPMYSNATLKDALTYSEGKYYHTHNVDSDGVAIAEPYDTEVSTQGQIVCLSEGTVGYQPYFPDIAVYADKFTLTKAITAVKELYKYGSPDLITDAVIAENGLSFTSASLTAGDLAYGVFEFDEPLRPLLTIKSRNDDATIADTANGKVYTFRPVITNGAIASWTVTEV